MIQIQDDNFNQSAPAPSLNQSPSPSTDNNSPDKSSNIDQLLAELDELSKNLEEKPSIQSRENFSNAKPATSEPVAVEKTESLDESKVDSPADEKFDFDGFLSDLEKKIDEQQTNENSSNDIKMADQATVDFPDSGKSTDIDKALGFQGSPVSNDFRKNRPTFDPQNQDEVVDETRSEVKDEIRNEAVASEPPAKPETDSEELKAQNIFEMLGLEKISDEEKNQFLDDLESMIWDDFVAHDLELLLTSEEYAGAREILGKQNQNETQQKEDLIAYLEKLIPDLDEVLYDKALELKSEMMGERLAKMKENADAVVLAKIKEAESLISQNRWKSAVSLLNQLA